MKLDVKVEHIQKEFGIVFGSLLPRSKTQTIIIENNFLSECDIYRKVRHIKKSLCLGRPYETEILVE